MITQSFHMYLSRLRQQPPGSMTTTEEMKKFIAASDTRLLNYQNCLFKIKMTFCQDLVQYENSLCLHAEIEEVVRAVLSIIQNKRHLVTIETQHFMVNISLIPWYAQQKLQFYKHENECQVYNHMIKLQFALRPSVSLQKSSQNSQQQIGCQKSISSTATKTPQREQVTQKDVLCDVSVEKNVPCKTSVETNCRQSVPTEECLKTANQKKKAEQQFSQSLLLGGGTVQDQSHLRDRHVVECGDLQEENHLQQLAAAYTATSAQDRKRNSSMLDWFLTPFKLALKNRKQ
ncbi:hypothetical protein C0Q70_04357 [Pomacea canaliculata]|uniref:Uncharacterized protein n=1 Tax=Pomacea canaliculata TaxID=400727 RepID=A0A2T7PVB8_POMCA|nr:hypothetical protein C0Q70_04357 [Pomacea canaliculata]